MTFHDAHLIEPKILDVSYAVSVDGWRADPSPQALLKIMDAFRNGEIQSFSIIRPDLVSVAVRRCGQNARLDCQDGGHPGNPRFDLTAEIDVERALSMVTQFAGGNLKWMETIQWDLPAANPAPYVDGDDNVVTFPWGEKELVPPAIRREKLRRTVTVEVALGALLLLAALVAIAAAASDLQDPLEWVLLATVPAVTILFHFINWRCPFCGKHLGTEFGRNCRCSAWPRDKSNC